jgi:hypothetical protein
MLTVLDLRYDAVLVAENLNGIVLIAVGAGVTAFIWAGKNESF